MISSWPECKHYLAADLARYEGPVWRTLVQLPQTRWQVRLRLTEWWCNTRGGPVGAVLRWRLMAHGVKLGYSIAINRLGPGTRLPHVGFIAINGGATVGRNCQILPGVVLGGTQTGAPQVGDDVFLGAGVHVIGGVSVGRGSMIAAGVTIAKDVPAGSVLVSPVPRVLELPS